VDWGCLAAAPSPLSFGAPILGNTAADLSKFLHNNSSLCAQVVSFAITAEGKELPHDLPTSQRAHMNHYN